MKTDSSENGSKSPDCSASLKAEAESLSEERDMYRRERDIAITRQEREMSDAWTMLNVLSANLMDNGPTWPRVLEWLKRNEAYRPRLYAQNAQYPAAGSNRNENGSFKPQPLFVLEQRFKPGLYFEWWGDENGGPYWTADLAKAKKLTMDRAEYEKGMVREETLIIPSQNVDVMPAAQLR